MWWGMCGKHLARRLLARCSVAELHRAIGDNAFPVFSLQSGRRASSRSSVVWTGVFSTARGVYTARESQCAFRRKWMKWGENASHYINSFPRRTLKMNHRGRGELKDPHINGQMTGESGCRRRLEMGKWGSGGKAGKKKKKPSADECRRQYSTAFSLDKNRCYKSNSASSL